MVLIHFGIDNLPESTAATLLLYSNGSEHEYPDLRVLAHIEVIFSADNERKNEMHLSVG